uniref:Calpain catalytic domain-containing protein n=1 Tax=Timema monikensis TaxID=170555 RepID=A0A7R9HP41_9NEOP|nr:unnamed protein product [Timema monikensis]
MPHASILKNGHKNGGANGYVKSNGHVKTNGHVPNGGPPGRQWMNGITLSRPDDKQSTLSRYWTTERPRAGTSNYQAVRRACRERGLLFEDPDFPPGPRALYHHKKPPLHPIVWMRPSEMCQRPKFIADGTGGNRAEGSRFDVEPGELGDTWLLAAVSSLTLTPRFLDRVVPPEQNFDNTTYCGLFSLSKAYALLKSFIAHVIPDYAINATLHSHLTHKLLGD